MRRRNYAPVKRKTMVAWFTVVKVIRNDDGIDYDYTNIIMTANKKIYQFNTWHSYAGVTYCKQIRMEEDGTANVYLQRMCNYVKHTQIHNFAQVLPDKAQEYLFEYLL